MEYILKGFIKRERVASRVGPSVGPPQLRPDFSGCHPAFQIKLYYRPPTACPVSTHPTIPTFRLHPHSPPSLSSLCISDSTIFQCSNHHQQSCDQSSYFIDHITPECLLWPSSCETGHNLASRALWPVPLCKQLLYSSFTVKCLHLQLPFL